MQQPRRIVLFNTALHRHPSRAAYCSVAAILQGPSPMATPCLSHSKHSNACCKQETAVACRKHTIPSGNDGVHSSKAGGCKLQPCETHTACSAPCTSQRRSSACKFRQARFNQVCDSTQVCTAKKQYSKAQPIGTPETHCTRRQQNTLAIAQGPDWPRFFRTKPPASANTCISAKCCSCGLNPTHTAPSYSTVLLQNGACSQQHHRVLLAAAIHHAATAVPLTIAAEARLQVAMPVGTRAPP